MQFQQLISLIDSTANLLGRVAWPTVFLIVVWRLLPQLRHLLDRLDSFSFKSGGIEATAEIKSKAKTPLTVASVQQAASAGSTMALRAAEAANYAVDRLTPAEIRKARGARALWVDDHPANNEFERQSMEALGIQFDIAVSTEDALNKVAQQRFDLIISDMARAGDQSAGYTLLDAVRKQGLAMPFIIYSSSNEPEHRAEAKRRGAFGQTNRASELFGLVLSTIDQLRRPLR